MYLRNLAEWLRWEPNTEIQGEFPSKEEFPLDEDRIRCETFTYEESPREKTDRLLAGLDLKRAIS